MLGEEPQRHIVVLDCNIYLDVARLLGPPFRWSELSKAAAQMAREPVPHPMGQMYDSLRAVAICTSGRFAGDETLEVWTNAHIDRLVRGKAMQPITPDPTTNLRGLGWSRDDAQTLVTELIEGLTSQSNGGTLGSGGFPDGNPPLDHEDGMVYGACRSLAGDDPLAKVYCVTRDGGFIGSYQAGSLGNHSRVVTPAMFVAGVRSARSQYSTQRMLRPEA